MYKLLKRQAWLIGVLVTTLPISCHRTEGNRYGLQVEKDIQTQKELAIDGSQCMAALADAHAAIPDTQVKQLIEAIPAGEVLVGILDPDTVRSMPIPVCFCEQGGQELMFVPESLLAEAACCLQAYYNKCPDRGKVQMVSVAALEDWIQILQKAGPGIGGRKDALPQGINLGYKDDGVDYFFNYPDDPYRWIRLCEALKMRNALNDIPPQGESWSCGINAAAKAIHMSGYGMSEGVYRDSFLPNAPKSVDKEAIERKGRGILLGGAAVFAGACLLAPFTGGASIVAAVPSWGVAAGGIVTATIGNTISSDVGPRPADLAAYITDFLPGTKGASYHSFHDFGACARAIRDDLRRGEPVIVFWAFGAALAHYVTVVGVSVDSNDDPQEFVIMDTNNCLYRYSRQEMEYLMRQDFASYVLVGATDTAAYHMVRFYR